MTPRYLVDKSVLARMPLEAVRRRVGPILEAGEAATCAIVDLEVLYSARNHEEHRKIRQRRALAYHSIPIDPSILDRAVEIQGELARKGHHRVPIPDLIIASAAQAAGVVVLHYDKDYDVIASVTGQPTEWVVPRGSL